MGRAFEYRKERKMKRWGAMAKAFTRIGRDIAIAVKAGGGDPDTNARLRACIQNAKAVNMPKDRVEGAIKRAISKDTASYDEMTYEGYGPGGAAIILECYSENKNRTVADLRHAFSKAGGNLGTDMVAKAAPDGYTLVLGVVGPIAINVTLYGKLPYDPARDFAGITTFRGNASRSYYGVGPVPRKADFAITLPSMTGRSLTSTRPPDGDTPWVRVSGVAVFGSVEVHVMWHGRLRSCPCALPCPWFVPPPRWTV